MTTRLRRYWPIVLPLIAGMSAVTAACGDDDDGAPIFDAPDGSVDAGSPLDGAPGADGSTEERDATTPLVDGGADADADAAPLPPLCSIYPDDMAFDAGDYAGYTRYQAMTFLTFESVTSACEVASIFENWGGDPDLTGCLGLQLPAVAGCTKAGIPLDYVGLTDPATTTVCFADGGTGVKVNLGLPTPNTPALSVNDVDLVIERIRTAALATGYSVADADRLRTLLQAQRAYMTLADAGTMTDAGHPSANCP